jgi:ABC-type glycerol-3-phosphate transport system permease component
VLAAQGHEVSDGGLPPYTMGLTMMAQMAAGVIATIPLVVVVLLFQRRIVAGLTSGSLK